MKEYRVQLQIKIVARNSSEAEELAKDIIESSLIWEDQIEYQVLGTIENG